MKSLKDRDVHGVTHTELAEHWHNGSKDEVVDNLARRHAAIAVSFVVQCARDGKLTRAECNELANMLNDHFIALRDQFGITATERRLQHASTDTQ